MISNFENLLELVVWPKYILENVLYALKENVYLPSWSGLLYMPVKSSWHTVLFKSYIYFLIFWLNSLSIIKSGVLISPSTIVVSVAKSCPALCEPMHCIMTGSPLLLYLHEFAQTHFHWVGDTIQPSHPLSLPSCLALNLSQHQGLFHWVGSSHQEAKLLELQHQPFQWIFMGLVKSKSLVSNWTTGRPSLKLSNLGKLLLIRFEFICFYFDHSFLSESLFLLTRI